MAVDPTQFYKGTGIPYFKRTGETSYRDMGSVATIEYTPSVNKGDKWAARGGKRYKAATYVNQLDASISLTLDEWRKENLALALGGSPADAVDLDTTADIAIGSKTLSDIASIGISAATGATVQTRQASTGSYAIGEVLTPDQDTGTEPEFTVTHLELSSATVATSGTGSNATGVTFTGTTGTGTKFTVTGDISSNTLSNIVIVTRGDYIGDLDDITAEPITAVGYTGYELSVLMGVKTVELTTPGEVTAFHSNPVTTTSDGDGTGATLNITWATVGLVEGRRYWVSGTGIPVGASFIYDGDDSVEMDRAATATTNDVAINITCPIAFTVFGESQVTGAFMFVSDNDVGPRIILEALSVIITPSGALQFLDSGSDDVGEIPLTIDVYQDSYGNFAQFYDQGVGGDVWVPA